MSGPATGRNKRPAFLPALSAWLALIGLDQTAAPQTLTSDLMRPVRDGFVLPQDSPLRKINDTGAADAPAGPTDAMAPSRIGRTPTYGGPAASGASDTGYESLNRKRKTPKLYPGAPKPKRPEGPGSTVPVRPAPPLTNPPSS